MTAARLAHEVEAAWAADTAGRRLLLGLLAPASAAYGAGVAVRNRLYDRGLLAAARVPATVVSVGNLTVGGTGKTPTALWLAAAFTARGRRVGLVARGYGKRRAGVVVVGVGGRALVDPAEGGDEAALAAARLALPVVTGERRADAARLACSRFGCDTIVLDDGFQHRALARDADLVLLPGEGLPARLLPAGPLREPVGALRRARAVLALGDETRLPARPAVPPGVGAYVGRVVPTGAVVAADGALVAHGLDVLPRRAVVGVAGVARPARFWRLLDRLGVQVAERIELPDHHAYGPADLQRIRAAARAGERSVVTTEKDLVKLARLPDAATLRLRAVRIEVAVEEGERLVDLLLAPAEVALRAD
jgi:tetraacyldisaccharide 4'-kinase